jgi:hypothetical protein
MYTVQKCIHMYIQYIRVYTLQVRVSTSGVVMHNIG